MINNLIKIMKNISKKLIIIIILIFFIGLGFGFYLDNYLQKNIKQIEADDLSLDDQEATIRAINKIIPTVVSIIVYDQEDYTSYNSSTGQKDVVKKKTEKGSGTGFIISADGLIITNKHVINVAEDKTAEFRIILNTGKEYYAQLIGKDPINDLALLKIFDKNLPTVELGDSDQLQIGSTVIAIGNSLGRYQNSATKGIVSGLGRNLVATDSTGNAGSFDDAIQTDAEINLGNSGGPLIDLFGRVIGINMAIDEGGTAIGFAIPVNDVRPVIKSAKESGRIIRPRLGVRYMMITSKIAKDNGLVREDGAWITKGEDGSVAITVDSSAAKGGLVQGDIIFEINVIKIADKNTLLSVIQKYKPGDKVGLKIQRGNKVIIKAVELDEFK